MNSSTAGGRAAPLAEGTARPSRLAQPWRIPALAGHAGFRFAAQSSIRQSWHSLAREWSSVAINTLLPNVRVGEDILSAALAANDAVVTSRFRCILTSTVQGRRRRCAPGPR